MRNFAALNPYAADTARSLAADSDTGKNRIGQCAVSNLDVLAGLHQRVSFASPPAFDGDAVIARRDIAAVDADVPAGIDIDAVAVPASRADGQVSNRYVFTVGGMDAPHQPVLSREAFQGD